MVLSHLILNDMLKAKVTAGFLCGLNFMGLCEHKRRYLSRMPKTRGTRKKQAEFRVLRRSQYWAVTEYFFRAPSMKSPNALWTRMKK